MSADADPDTGALVYDSYRQNPPGFAEVGGTSEATPIIAAIYALAGMPARGSYPAQYPYLHASHLFDVRSGVNGTCESFRRYLCHAGRGYDGPTGLGTPNGTHAFTDNSAHLTTLVDPGTQDLATGSRFALTITGLDTRTAPILRWSAIGLPAGLSIHADGHSTSHTTRAKITGMLPAGPGTFHVTVTARDGKITGTTHFRIVTVPSLKASDPPSGPVELHLGRPLPGRRQRRERSAGPPPALHAAPGQPGAPGQCRQPGLGLHGGWRAR